MENGRGPWREGIEEDQGERGWKRNRNTEGGWRKTRERGDGGGQYGVEEDRV